MRLSFKQHFVADIQLTKWAHASKETTNIVSQVCIDNFDFEKADDISIIHYILFLFFSDNRWAITRWLLGNSGVELCDNLR